MSTRAWLLVLCLALVSVTPLFAAMQNAVLYGTVYDAGGQPMPGVTVLLQNTGLGISRSTTTGSDGSYNFAEVPPAEDYRLTASKGGRALDIRGGIEVNVGDERVILPPLTEQVVAADAPVEVRTVSARDVGNETASTAISGVITGNQLRSLPLYNRNFLALGLLTPNVRDTEAGSELGGASFSISGTRPSSNSFLLDGTDNVASSSNQAVPFQVNDSIQEFRVVSSTASAEYGRGQGGVVNIVTRRGGNTFHGSAYGYFASDALNAESPLSVYNGTTFDQAAAYAGPLTGPLTVDTTPLNYNDYVRGAQSQGFCTNSLEAFTGTPGPNACITGGGPGFFSGPLGSGPGFTGRNDLFDPATILAANDSREIPFDSKQFGVSAGGALVKDKLFFFTSYEGTRIDNPTPIFERVPSSFDRTYDPLATGLFRFDPANCSTGTCTNAPTAIGDASAVLAQDILSLFPAPNVVGVPGVLEFFRGEAPNFTNVHNGLARVDYAQSANDSWTARYVLQRLDQLHSATLPEQADYPGNGALRDALNQNLNISYLHTFSPSVINEIRGGFNRFRVNETAQDASFDATTLGVSGFNLPSPALPTILLHGIDPQSSGATPGFNGAFSGFTDNAAIMRPTLDYLFPFARLGAPLIAPGSRADTTLFISDSLSITSSRHAIKLGADFRKLRNRVNNGAFSRGFVYSSNIGEFTSDSETCNEDCASFIGADSFSRPSFDFAQRQAEDFAGRFDSYAVAAYVQDTYRLHPRWTLNYGVRYEYFSPPKEIADRVFNYEPSANGLVQQGRLGNVLDPLGFMCPSQPTVYGSIPFPVSNPPPLTIPPPPAWTCNPSAATGKIINSDRNNLGARGGLAWDLYGDGKTVLRFGIGWYYDQLPTSYLYPLLFNDPALSSNNTLFGQIAETQGGFCVNSFGQCGTGISILNLAVLGATSPDGVNPNSLYSQTTTPFGVYARDASNSNAPYVRQINGTVQQALGNKLAMEVGYVGTSGKQLPAVFNSNFGNEFNAEPHFSGIGPSGNFLFVPIFTMTHRAESSYHSLMARVRVADWHGLRLNASYNLANASDNASIGFYPTVPTPIYNFLLQSLGQTRNPNVNCVFFPVNNCASTIDPNNPANQQPASIALPQINFSTGAVTTTGLRPPLVTPYLIPQDPFSFLNDDQGRSDFHTKHRFVLDYTWEVPFWQKSRWMGNWQVSGIFVAQSGQPFSIFTGPLLGELTQRAVALGPVTVTNNPDDPNGAVHTDNLATASAGNIDSVNSIFVPSFCTFAPFTPPTFTPSLFQPQPGVACKGNTRRNEFTGPNFTNFNLAVQKGFSIFGEGRMLTLRAEFYNLLNRGNFYNPISQLSVDAQTINPNFGKIKSAHDPRQVQLAVRFSW